MTRVAHFQKLGGFDTRYFVIVENVDYCWRTILTGFEVPWPMHRRYSMNGAQRGWVDTAAVMASHRRGSESRCGNVTP
jgi:GT2 family glycosyltransferase